MELAAVDGLKKAKKPRERHVAYFLVPTTSGGNLRPCFVPIGGISGLLTELPQVLRLEID